ncbi:hypothetical protein HII36_02285 [Nonomuraea sp. NN258]|uniref:hypothetical protein n=1 Tax=Nonomuraea antri TaxID=2730852 RepID=UPI0015698011|nr:hypothetical protein [Nonomuraea antri]NRQ30670.1 hypothetical protein [Nonomuraea antri]
MIVLFENIESGALADARGTAHADALQQEHPAWCVMYAPYHRTLLAIYMGPSSEPVIEEAGSATEMRERLDNAELMLAIEIGQPASPQPAASPRPRHGQDPWPVLRETLPGRVKTAGTRPAPEWRPPPPSRSYFTPITYLRDPHTTW